MRRWTGGRAPGGAIHGHRRSWKLFPNVFLRESSGLGSQHVGQFSMAHADLVPDRYQAGGEMIVVLAQQGDGQHDVVDVAKDEGAAGSISVFGLKEADGMIPPMPARVQVMRRVPAIVETESVTLRRRRSVGQPCNVAMGRIGHARTGTSIKVTLERKSESGSTSSTRAC